jgi:hypothetical protein
MPGGSGVRGKKYIGVGGLDFEIDAGGFWGSGQKIYRGDGALQHRGFETARFG